ncbi:MAG TPA: diguanylate cyclase [Thiobacillus sp.]|nr:diguanylate cyclase [Thiobacillus sp.]
MKVYQRIFEYTPDALLLVDQAGRITLANAQAEILFGYDRSELIGQAVEMLVPPRFAAHHVGHRAGFMAESHGRPMGAAVELYAQRKDGSELPVDILLSPMIMDGRHFTLCVVRDITERKAAEDKLRQQTAELQKLHAELKELANRDSLTGLLNRRAFHEHAAQMLRTARRRKESAALLMVDLDHFKQVNDRFGHAEGDHVLKMVAATLKATARENDIVARHGGEEFVVAVLGASEAESIAAAERLRLAIAAITNTKSNITASIGVTTCAPHVHKREASQILEELLAQADRALYAAKHNGRNQVCHFNRLAQHGPLLPSPDVGDAM